MRTSVWLIRHGQTQSNRERRYQSHSDSPLTSYGRRQVAALAERLRAIPFGLIIASPRERTRLAAEAILAGRRGAALRADPAWAEADHGRWEGLTYREVLARFPEEARARWGAGINGKAAGGESLAEASDRITAAWRQLLRDNPGGRILIATHATPIQLVLSASLGTSIQEHWRWRIDLGSLTCLDVYPSGAIIRMVNEVPRLGATPL
ncbi:histidine phosphatase family protein [Oscillochloris sp. ZM17-4]|uniref:histidine phosphatase family protein n=1 Tax=Oscillochloris sp. ZM17-4 TaxID=2866714 RepID=UPI001C730C79|nr:histidine phosphatase family protein [Oscillochloris sp. ZM17-4]MBX0330242.1 histidine phosphatase family protein [Oscillochloris sp. ZM17-4]